MSLYLLDSDCLIDFIKGIPTSVTLVRDLFQQLDDVGTCDVVVAEVWSGLREHELESANELVGTFEFLPTTVEIAQQAGRWRYVFARRGVQLSTQDTLIAATASLYNATLVTANLKDFPMDGLRILELPR